jgi:hypothetical protein
VCIDNAGSGGTASSGDAAHALGVRQAPGQYSGAGGQAQGGSVSGNSGLLDLIRLFSDNAGNGGQANSGAAGLGARDSSYSGVGGQAGGGSVADSPGVVNLWSGNAGDGGFANSGASGAH